MQLRAFNIRLGPAHAAPYCGKREAYREDPSQSGRARNSQEPQQLRIHAQIITDKETKHSASENARENPEYERQRASHTRNSRTHVYRAHAYTGWAPEAIGPIPSLLLPLLTSVPREHGERESRETEAVRIRARSSSRPHFHLSWSLSLSRGL